MWGLWLSSTGSSSASCRGSSTPTTRSSLAPAIAALVGAGVVELWSLRERFRFGGVALAGAILVSAVWSWQLLERAPGFVPGLGLVVLIVGAIVALVLCLPATADLRRTHALAVALGIGVLLAGPAAYTISTMSSAYSSGDPRPGPAVASDSGQGGFGGGQPGGGPAGGRFGGGIGTGAAPGGGAADSTLASYLSANQGTATWIVAMTSAMQAGSLELATGEPVMAMGGFSGTDPAPSLAQIQAYVASGQLRYVLVGGNGGGPGAGPGGGAGGGSTASAVTAWVTSVGKVVDYGGSSGTLYDLSGVATSGT